MRKLLALSVAAAALITAGSAYADTMAVATATSTYAPGRFQQPVIGVERQPVRQHQRLRAERPLVHRRL